MVGLGETDEAQRSLNAAGHEPRQLVLGCTNLKIMFCGEIALVST